MVSGDDVRRALIDRVSRRESGHGVARRVVDGAVDRVVAALPTAAAALRALLSVVDPADAALVRA